MSGCEDETDKWGGYARAAAARDMRRRATRCYGWCGSSYQEGEVGFGSTGVDLASRSVVSTGGPVPEVVGKTSEQTVAAAGSCDDVVGRCRPSQGQRRTCVLANERPACRPIVLLTGLGRRRGCHTSSVSNVIAFRIVCSENEDLPGILVAAPGANVDPPPRAVRTQTNRSWSGPGTRAGLAEVERTGATMGCCCQAPP